MCALIVPSSIISEARGTVGLQIFSRNRSGAIVRSWASPTQSASTRAATARTNFANCVSQWQSFSDNEKSDWDEFAKGEHVTQGSISSAIMSGRELFIRRSMVLKGGSPSIFAFQVPSTPRRINEFFVSSSDANAFNFTFNASATDLGHLFALFCSPPVSSSVRSFNSTYFIRTAAQPVFVTRTFDIKTNYESIFGAGTFIAGTKFLCFGREYQLRSLLYPTNFNWCGKILSEDFRAIVTLT